MSFDWFLEYDVIHDKSDIDKCVNGNDKFGEIINIYSRVKLLATCLNKNNNIRNYAKNGDNIRDPKGHKFIIHRGKYNNLINDEITKLKNLNLYRPYFIENIYKLPRFSFFLQFTFTLSKPYISRDDEEFYIIDNPVRKDKVFKVPMVSGSSWKGNMRWVAMKLFADSLPETLTQEEIKDFLYCRAQMVRLFGYEKDSIENYLDTILAEAFCTEDEKQNVELFKEKRKYISENFQKLLKDKGYIDPKVEGRRGRLNFHPTFFNQIGLEVINPHDRKTKAGTLPIYIECVPENATGTFSILYVPFDLIGKPDKLRKDVIEDLDIVYNSLKDMMLTYGFSAKKSSGFGIIFDSFSEGLFDMSGIPLTEKNYNDFDGLEKIIANAVSLVNKDD